MNKDTKKDKILSNLVESKYANVFLTFLDKSWYEMSVTFTDLDEQIMKYSEFIEFLHEEIDFISDSYKKEIAENKSFQVFYFEDKHLEELTEGNYQNIVKSPEPFLLVTQDQKEALKLLESYQEYKRKKE